MEKEASATTTASIPNRQHLFALLLWKDLRLSALVVVLGSALLLGLLCCSFVWLAGALGLAALAAALVHRVWLAVRGPSGEAEVEWHVSEEAATRAVRSALPHVNDALDTLRRLFLLESFSDALKAGFALWVLSTLGAYFNLLSLLLIVWIGAFTLPVLYVTYRPHLKQLRDMLQSKFAESLKGLKVN